MMYKLTVKKTHRIVCECKYVGDISIEIEERFNDEGYALELQAWCENAKDGDMYDDEHVTIEVVCE